MPAPIPEPVYLERIATAGADRYEFVEWASELKGHKTKVTVKCLVDGFVWTTQVSSLLVSGTGCPHCSGKRKWTLDEYIERVRVVAAGRYEVAGLHGKFAAGNTKLKLRCTATGYEWVSGVKQRIHREDGCPCCSKSITPPAHAREAQLGGIDGLSFVGWDGEYTNNKSKAVMRCDCGHAFSATINNLIDVGQGCPRCCTKGFQIDKHGSLYALMSECGGMVKIGISNKPEQRLKTLARDTPFSWTQIAQIDSQDGAQIARFEKELHDATEQAITDAKFDGYTEWRKYNPAILETLELYRAQAV